MAMTSATARLFSFASTAESVASDIEHHRSSKERPSVIRIGRVAACRYSATKSMIVPDDSPASRSGCWLALAGWAGLRCAAKAPPELLAEEQAAPFRFQKQQLQTLTLSSRPKPYPSESEGQEGKSGGRGGSPGLLRAEIVAIDPTIQGRGK